MKFFFHYNKPQSLKLGKPVISLHFNKTCYMISNVICNVPTKGKIKKRQPRWVIEGNAKSINIVDSIAYIE